MDVLGGEPRGGGGGAGVVGMPVPLMPEMAGLAPRCRVGSGQVRKYVGWVRSRSRDSWAQEARERSEKAWERMEG